MEKDKNNENEYYTRLIESKIFDFLSSHPESAKKIIDMLTPLKEQKEVKRNKKFMKFLPYIIAGTFAFGSAVGVIGKDQVDKNTPPSYPVTYSRIEDAPIEIQKAYVDGQYLNLTTESTTSDKFNYNEESKKYAAFEKLINSENPNEKDITTMARDISNGTPGDNADTTYPFEFTEFSKSIVKDGDVYVPAGNDIEDGEDLTSQDGMLYKKGR